MYNDKYTLCDHKNRRQYKKGFMENTKPIKCSFRGLKTSVFTDVLINITHWSFLQEERCKSDKLSLYPLICRYETRENRYPISASKSDKKPEDWIKILSFYLLEKCLYLLAKFKTRTTKRFRVDPSIYEWSNVNPLSSKHI